MVNKELEQFTCESLTPQEEGLVTFIERERDARSTSRFLFKHQDGTRILWMVTSDKGEDIVFFRNDQYLRVAAHKGPDARCDVSIGRIGTNDRWGVAHGEEISLPLVHSYTPSDHAAISTALGENKELKNIFDKYIVDDFKNMARLRYRKTDFQKALNNFNKWKHMMSPE